MARTHILAHFQIVGQRQHAARGNNFAVADDHGTVMQGRTLVKNGAQHLADDIGVHRRAGADDLVQIVAALQNHQCAGARVGKLLGGVTDGNHGILPCPAQGGVGAPVAAEQLAGPCGALPHTLQRAAQLRLKDDHSRHKADGDDVV